MLEDFSTPWRILAILLFVLIYLGRVFCCSTPTELMPYGLLSLWENPGANYVPLIPPKPSAMTPTNSNKTTFQRIYFGAAQGTSCRIAVHMRAAVQGKRSDCPNSRTFDELKRPTPGRPRCFHRCFSQSRWRVGSFAWLHWIRVQFAWQKKKHTYRFVWIIPTGGSRNYFVSTLPLKLWFFPTSNDYIRGETNFLYENRAKASAPLRSRGP